MSLFGLQGTTMMKMSRIFSLQESRNTIRIDGLSSRRKLELWWELEDPKVKVMSKEIPARYMIETGSNCVEINQVLKKRYFWKECKI